MTLFTRRRPAPAVRTFPNDESNPEQPMTDTAVDDAVLDGITFASLGVAPDLADVLSARGITSPFPVQALTIADALAGRDVCGKAKTGSGKTLAFGLPLIEHTTSARSRHPRSLVLVPTRELANQVAEELVPLAAARGLWLMPVYGGVSINRQISGLRQGVDIVIATPGRLNDLLERGDVSMDDVNFVVLDEADQMADMGFMPQVERILRQVDSDAQTLLFSATLDGDVGQLVRKYQTDPVMHEVASDTVGVETLEQRFIGVTNDGKLGVTARILAGASRAIVFVKTTHGADRLVKQLEREGLRADAIHGRRSQSQRERTLDAFSKGRSPILVATNVAARGIHVDHVDLVMHFDPPEDAKVYLHRSGRTARAGADGMVVTLVLPEQHRDVYAIERGAGLEYTIEEMRPDDSRLSDLGAWEPTVGMPRELGMSGSTSNRRRAPRGAHAGQRNNGSPRSEDGRPGRGPWRRRSNRRTSSNS